MKKHFKLAVLLPLAFLLPLSGCLERHFAEEKAVLSVDVEDIVVPGDVADGPDMVTDTLVVTANRSWSAYFKTDVDWVEMESDEHLDLSEVMEDVKVVLKFKDNRDGADRSVVLHVTAANGEKDVTIRQKAMKHRLVLMDGTDARIAEGESSYEATVRCELDTCVVAFNTNMPWTAKIQEGNTAGVKLSKTSGDGASSMKVYFGENEDSDNTKSAVIVLSADGCDDIKIAFTQLEGTPYVKILERESGGVNIPSIGGRYPITVKSNVAWSMKVKDGERLKAKFLKAKKDDSGATIKDEAGVTLYDYLDEYQAEKGEKSVTVAFLGNDDFANDGTITLQMNAPGAEPAEATYTVDKASYVFLGCRKWPDIYSDSSTSSTYWQPFMYDMWPSGKCLANERDIEACNGYKFRMHTFGTVYPAAASPTARMCVNSAGGFNIGTGYNYIYIAFPAVPGKRLAKVCVMNGSTSTSTDYLRFGIIDESEMAKIDNNEYGTKVKFTDSGIKFVTGGDHAFLAASIRKSKTYNTPAETIEANPGSYGTWELPSTKENTVYALASSYATGIRWKELYYE